MRVAPGDTAVFPAWVQSHVLHCAWTPARARPAFARIRFSHAYPIDDPPQCHHPPERSLQYAELVDDVLCGEPAHPADVREVSRYVCGSARLRDPTKRRQDTANEHVRPKHVRLRTYAATRSVTTRSSVMGAARSLAAAARALLRDRELVNPRRSHQKASPWRIHVPGPNSRVPVRASCAKSSGLHPGAGSVLDEAV